LESLIYVSAGGTGGEGGGDTIAGDGGGGGKTMFKGDEETLLSKSRLPGSNMTSGPNILSMSVE
jgi:hypothetical protein